MNLEDIRELVEKMITGGVRSADAELLVRKNIKVDGEKIRIGKKTFQRDEYEEIVLLGIGKASVSMAIGCGMIHPDDGLVIADSNNYGEVDRCPVKVRFADHPYPKQANIDAAEELFSIVKDKDNALFIFLISGGGSALFTLPAEGIPLSDLNKLNKLLVKSGANIHQINTVRKHLSRVKGGRLGKLCSKKGDIASLIISDVVGDDLSVIASGPTYPDHSTYEDAKEVLKEFDLWNKISDSIRERIDRGVNGELDETPTKSEVHNFLIGNNMTALQGAKKIAEDRGLDNIILTSQNQGEARAVAKPLMGIAKEIQDTGNPIKPPATVILGGETTVRFSSEDTETGKGGPNRELVLSSAIEIKDRENIVVGSVDSDGIDGMDKAGAIADTSTIEKCELDPKEHLEKHDSQPYFDSLSDSIEFESRTNVNDITVIIVEEKE